MESDLTGSQKEKVTGMARQFILASDFDQTLSFNDSGVLLAELIGAPGFGDKVAGLSRMHLVQQGAELSYLILHDPDFRRVRRDDLIETGKRVRLKQDVASFCAYARYAERRSPFFVLRDFGSAAGDHHFRAGGDRSA